jgi:hypothetical protein
MCTIMSFGSLRLATHRNALARYMTLCQILSCKFLEVRDGFVAARGRMDTHRIRNQTGTKTDTENSDPAFVS